MKGNTPLELRPTPKLTYKLRLSPQMRLSLNLLQLPLIKLKEYIKEEIEKNPLLETIDRESSEVPTEKLEDILTAGEQKQPESNMPWAEEEQEKRDYRESIITKPTTLQEHLLRQLRLLTSFEEELKIGESIIGNLNDSGFLRTSLKEIAETTKTSPSKVEKILFLIQTFDPIGVGARDLRECLLLQLKAKGEEKFLPAPTIANQRSGPAGRQALAGQIVDKYLPCLEKKRYKFIAKKLRISVEKVKEAMKEIAALEPKPGRLFSEERTIRLIPDAVLRKDKERYEAILNTSELPHITINDKYRRMIKQKKTSEDTKEYLKGRLKTARALIDAVKKRKETLQKIIEEIIYVQRDFLDSGSIHLKPMTLSQIADRVGKHKSTVSRAVSNKFLQTPYGILELRYFLSSGVRQKNGEFFSSKKIKFKIQELTRREDKKNPLTDQEITNQLRQDGISVPRRTISKYRNQLKILPSKSRQE